MTEMTDDSQPKFITTREAAKRLGVALATVQSWVEAGVLPAWKTAGGHRRIPVKAIEEFEAKQQATLETPTALTPKSPTKLKVLVVEDEPFLLKLYEVYFTKKGLPIELLTAENGFSGLMMIGRHTPDLLITDLAMPGMDGYHMIKHLADHGGLGRMKIIVVTGKSMEDIEADGGLPSSIAIYHKPIPFEDLQRDIEEMVEQRNKR